MPSLERRTSDTGDPAALRPMLLAVEHWPAWCPLLRKVTPGPDDGGPEGSWSIVALLGAMPFSGFARLVTSDDGLQIALVTLTSASPVEFARYTFSIGTDAAPALALRVEYAIGRGPGGWLAERFLVRRRLPEQITTTLAALVNLDA